MNNRTHLPRSRNENCASSSVSYSTQWSGGDGRGKWMDSSMTPNFGTVPQHNSGSMEGSVAQSPWQQPHAPAQSVGMSPPVLPPPPHLPPPHLPSVPPPLLPPPFGPPSQFNPSAPPPGLQPFSHLPPGFSPPQFSGAIPKFPENSNSFAGNVLQFPHSDLSFPPPPLPFSHQQFASSSKQNSQGETVGRDVNGQDTREELHRRQGAQDEVDRWLKKIGKFKESVPQPGDEQSKVQSMASPQQISEAKKSLTICEAHSRLRGILHSLAAVQGALQQLEEDQETADAETWRKQVENIKQLKTEYLAARQQLEEGQITELQKKLEQRRKKRARLRRQKEEKHEAEEQVLYERAQKHAAIDKWQDQILQEHLKQKQIKEMKETADKTLGKVRRETKEARKMLETLTALQKLRTVRTDTAARRGQTFPGDIAEHFKEKTDDLIKLLSQQIEEYEKEEASLKLILETEQEEAKEKERQAKKEQERERKQLELHMEAQSLFGPPVMRMPCDPMLAFDSFYQQAQFDFQALLSIRHSWDMFLVPENAPGASRIPDGWVEPEQPSSATWASALQTEMEVESSQTQDSSEKPVSKDQEKNLQTH